MKRLIFTTGLLMACATHAQEPAPVVNAGTANERTPELRIWQRSTPAPVNDLNTIPNEYAPSSSPEPLRIEFTRGLSPVQATNPPVVAPEPAEPLFLEAQPKPAEPLFIEPIQAITPTNNPEPLFLEPTTAPTEAIKPVETDEPLFLTDSDLPPELDPFFIPEPNWDELDTSLPESDWFDFEVVLFSYPPGKNFETGDPEVLPEVVSEPDPDGANGGLNNDDVEGDFAQRLPPSEFVLNGAVKKLTRDGYTVHAHQRWRQATPPRDTDNWYRIGDDQLYGLVRVNLGRYLHFATDLVFSDRETGLAHPIQLNRRMRSEQLQYIDHPRVGVLLTALRYEPPKPEVIEETPAPVEEAPIEKPVKKKKKESDIPRATPDLS
jgi:hypothetical protein